MKNNSKIMNDTCVLIVSRYLPLIHDVKAALITVHLPPTQLQQLQSFFCRQIVTRPWQANHADVQFMVSPSIILVFPSLVVRSRYYVGVTNVGDFNFSDLYNKTGFLIIYEHEQFIAPKLQWFNKTGLKYQQVVPKNR